MSDPADARRPVIGVPMLVAAAVAAVAVLVWHVVALPIDKTYYGLFYNFADLAAYRAAGDVVLHRGAVYGSAVLVGMEFTYPPFAGILFVPLALVSQAKANILWWAGTFAALVALVALSLRSLGYALDKRAALLSVLLAIVVTSFEPVRQTIWFGQINVFLVLLVVWDLTRADGSRLKGIGTGIAAGIKLTPGFFVVYLALTRQWRTCVTVVATFAATVAVGFAVMPSQAWLFWMAQVSNPQRVGPVDSPSNQSVNGFVAQMLAWYDVSRFQHPDKNWVYEAPLWLWLPLALVAGVLGLAASRVAHRLGQELLAVVLTGQTAATVSPFSWGHHWVWFVPLFVLALHYAMTAAARWRWLVPAALMVPVFSWLYSYYDGPEIRGAPYPIAIGFFMMPRSHDVWWNELTVPLYAGCYPAVFVITAVAVLLAARRHRVAPPPIRDAGATDC